MPSRSRAASRRLGDAAQVIVDVPEVEAGLLGHARIAALGEQREDVALGGEHLAHLHQRAFEREDPGQVRPLGALEDGVLDLLQVVRHEVEDREVGVDDGVGDQVEDKVRPAPPQRGLACGPLPDPVERLDRVLVDGDQVVRAQESVQLVRHDVVRLARRAGEPVDHHEQVVAVFLQLRPLVDVQAVLDRQRVKAEAIGQELERRFVLGLKVDPANHARRRRRGLVCVTDHRARAVRRDVEDTQLGRHRDKTRAHPMNSRTPALRAGAASKAQPPSSSASQNRAFDFTSESAKLEDGRRCETVEESGRGVGATSVYVLGERLQRGPRSSVFRAVRGVDGRALVLKVLDPKHSRPRDVDRLRNEYEVGRTLKGLAVVEPLALSSFEGQPALELEDFQGVSLDRLMGQPMPIAAFLTLAAQVARVVADVHGRGVIHKDLKPHNILLDHESGQVRIADFCIAARIAREQSTPWAARLIEGSLPYVSPEQTGRMNRSIDSRSDLYSLGVSFYQLLTGRLPFEATDAIGWVYSHVARKPTPPRAIRPSVPGVLSDIILKLLAKVPDERYQSAVGPRLRSRTVPAGSARHRGDRALPAR